MLFVDQVMKEVKPVELNKINNSFVVDEDCHDNSLISNRAPPSEGTISVLQLSWLFSESCYG